MRICLLVLLALLGIVLVGCTDQEPVATTGIIHRPRTGCPAGYTEVPNVFERGGVLSAACVDPTRDHVIDYLNPGESLRGSIMITQPPAPPKKGVARI